MSSLRAALILIIAGGATTAYAEQITCESHQSQTEACGTLQPGGDVRLVQQLSSTACVEGQNWGIRTSPNHDAIWVSGGCRAVFDVQPSYNSTADRVQYDNSTSPTTVAVSTTTLATTCSKPTRTTRRHGSAVSMMASAACSTGARIRPSIETVIVQARTRCSTRTVTAIREIPRTHIAAPNRRRRPRVTNAPTDSAYASGESPRRIARSACIEQAASGQPFGSDQIRTGDVRWIGQGLMAVNVDTPDGPLMCTVDRDGNVRSIESR
jgi:hypothetical protein